MKREQAKELLPIIQAYAEGKTIQHKVGDEWCDLSDPNFASFDVKLYRVKPEKNEKTMYYCYLDRDMDFVQFMFTSKKPSSHVYEKFTRSAPARDWCYSHDKFAEVAKAWEDGKTIQYFSDTWEDCVSFPSFWLSTKYRVKPELIEVETRMKINNSEKQICELEKENT